MIKKRILNTFYASSFGQIVTICIQLFAIPFFVTNWGVALYGDWLIISTIPTYLLMSELGFASAAGTEMTMSVGRNDRATALSTFQSLQLLLIGSITLVLLATVIILWSIQITPWIPVKNISVDDASVVLVLFSLQVMVGLFGTSLTAGFMCDGHFPFITFWSNMIRLLETIGLIAGVSLGGGVVESAAVVLIIKSIGTFLLCMALKKRIQWLRLGFSSASLKECRRLLKPAITYMAFPLGNALSMQGFVFVIGMMLNSSAVVVFNTLRTLTRVTSQVMTTIHMSVRPEISFAYGSANFELAKNLHRRAAQWSIYSAVLIFIVLNFIGGYVYQFWLSGKVVFDANLFMWLLISAAVNTVWYTSSAVLMATNTHQGIALAYLFETTISLALAVILINEYNIIGAGMATIFGDIFMTIIVLRHSFKLLQDNLVDFMQEVLFKPSLLLIDVKKILGNRFKRKYI